MMPWDSAVSWADPAKAFPRSNGGQRDLMTGVKPGTPLARTAEILIKFNVQDYSISLNM